MDRIRALEAQVRKLSELVLNLQSQLEDTDKTVNDIVLKGVKI